MLIGSLAAASCVAGPYSSRAGSTAPSSDSTAQAPEWGWRCTGGFEVEGQQVIIWRDFDASGALLPYRIQTVESEPNGTYWTIDPRPDGPAKGEPVTWNTGRSEAEVLRDGPDYVHINFPWYTAVTGPVYAHFWGDGTYAGAERLFTARQVRHSTGRDGKMGGLSGGLSKGPTMQSLYRAQIWAFKVTDATGKELTSGSFHPPDLARAAARYRLVRTEIDQLETEFRTDFETKVRGSTICEADEDPASTI